MNIVVCYKLVPDEQDIKINHDRTLDLNRAEWKIGAYDLNALEAAVELSEGGLGEEVIALTAGGEIVENSKLAKGILARGATKMLGLVDDSFKDADNYSVANVLAGAIKEIGNVDLVLCGEGSSDLYAQQVGPVLGQLLGYTNLNAVGKITVNGGNLIVERNLENGMEELEVTLPAVLTVTSNINKPRIPTMRDILAANKKPYDIKRSDELGAKISNKLESVSILAPEQAERKKIIIKGDSEEKIAELYEHLRKIL